MVKPIVRDVFFLSRPSVPATAADLPVARDLLDTLQANADRCVGMAANMIGVNKNIIVFTADHSTTVMFNPTITAKGKRYETEEGCLSLDGVRKCVRYENIEVSYRDITWKVQKRRYSGWAAEIIQHEIDHLSGIII